MSNPTRLRRPAPPRRPEGDPPPLEGLRVVDLSRVFAGPLCTMTLADLGADVIKVEPPRGDEARGFGPPFLGGESMNFMAMNRNKRSLALNLKHPEGVAIARKLCINADVVVENFRPGVADKLGVGYEELSAENPGLVYCSISGFGSKGPYEDRAALDIVLQGMSGTMDRQGAGKKPGLIVITIADTYAAAQAVQGILAALLARARDGRGQHVQVNLFEGLLASQTYRIISPAADEAMLPAPNDICPYQAFRARDGWFTLAAITERSWEAFCPAIGHPGLLEDPRFATNADRVVHQEELIPMLEDIFAEWKVDELIRTLDEAGVPCGPVKKMEELFTDEHVLDNEMVIQLEHETAGPLWTLGLPLHLQRTPPIVRRPAPTFGEHSEEIVAELGYSEAEIARLRAEKAII